jgi:hypothetical protein
MKYKYFNFYVIDIQGNFYNFLFENKLLYSLLVCGRVLSQI